MTDKKMKLAWLEAESRQQDDDARKRARELRNELDDPRVQLGIEAVIRDNVDEAADAISAAVIRLAERLAGLGLISEGNPGTPGYFADFDSGEMVAAVHTRDGTFWEQGTQLIEQRESKGRMLYRRLDDQGEPVEDWQDAPPPPSQSAGN